MRILITYGRRAPYPPFGIHLAKAFEEAGHSALLLCVRDRPWWGGWIKRAPEPWKSRWRWDPVTSANERLLQTARWYRPDMLLEISGDLLHAATLQDLKRRYRTALMLWRTEGPGMSPVPVLGEYDVLMSISRVEMVQLRAAGFRHVVYLPYATDPQWFRPLRSPHWRHPLGCIGVFSPRREAFLESVVDLGLCLWGPDWETKSASPAIRHALISPQGIFGKTLVQCYQTTKLFISAPRETNMPRLGTAGAKPSGLGWRHFDIPACGSMLLNEWVEELPEAFEIGKEVDGFATPEELREKVRYYLTHEVERTAMVQRGRARVLRDHTYAQRVPQIIQWAKAVTRI